MFPFGKTIESLFKVKLLGIMLICAAIAIFIVLCAVGGIVWISAFFITFETGWLNTLFNWLLGILTGIGGWFMLPVLTVLAASFFQETVIKKVEEIYYPDSTQQEKLIFIKELWQDIKFTILAISLNLLILPLYFIGIGLMMSILLNSYLLGREFFESAAGYHIGKRKARELGNKNKTAVYGGGLVITVLTLVPVLNLIMPIFAVIWMVHVYHKVNSYK